MDLMVSVLESLPAQKQFTKRDCLKYENDLLTQYEPMAEETPQEPAVSRVGLFFGLCVSK